MRLCGYVSEKSVTSERQFIRNLQRQFPVRPPVVTGIGDDGAVLNCETETRQVVVIDMLLDQVHFDLRSISPNLAGRKAVAVNLSDLAAMACWPTAAFVSVAVPKTLESPETFLSDLYEGMADLANRFRFTIAGGDTNTWDGPFAINVCLTGVPMAVDAVLRSGARPGDALLVTGSLGGSLKSGRHLTFEPQLETARWLIENMQVHAMMDISDGLSIDLHRMMEASETGAMLEAERIPIHSDVMSSMARSDWLNRAFSDGEDFELLLAVPEDALPKKGSQMQAAGRVLHRIGTVTEHPGRLDLRSSDGSIAAIDECGWQHNC